MYRSQAKPLTDNTCELSDHVTSHLNKLTGIVCVLLLPYAVLLRLQTQTWQTVRHLLEATLDPLVLL